jgi:hypothetical protein
VDGTVAESFCIRGVEPSSSVECDSVGPVDPANPRPCDVVSLPPTKERASKRHKLESTSRCAKISACVEGKGTSSS